MPARLGEPSGNAARIAPRRVVASCRRAGSRVSSRRCAAKTRFWHAGPVRKPPNRGRMPHSQGSMKRDLGFCCKVSTSKMLKSTEGCQKLVFAAHGTTETCAPVDVPRATVTAPSARSASPARVLATDAVAPRLRWRTAQMFHVRHSRASAEREGSATRPFPISERPRSPSSSSAAVATAQPRQPSQPGDRRSRRNRAAPAAVAARRPSQPRSPGSSSAAVAAVAAAQPLPRHPSRGISKYPLTPYTMCHIV